MKEYTFWEVPWLALLRISMANSILEMKMLLGLLSNFKGKKMNFTFLCHVLLNIHIIPYARFQHTVENACCQDIGYQAILHVLQ